jgi:protein SCO1/2
MSEDVREPREARRPRRGTVVALLMILAGIGAAFVTSQRRHAVHEGLAEIIAAGPQKAEDLPVLGAVGDFSLTERGGGTVTDELLKGRVWVADFFFTYCGMACPAMSRNMSQLHREFVGPEEPKFVSFTADPLRDTLEVMSEYGRMNQADPDRWWFLTGDEKVLQRTAHSLLLPYELGNPASHSSKFMLVDREGRIRGAYDGTSGPELDKLRRDLKLLLSAPKG